MAIDQKARQRLFEDGRTKALVEGMKSSIISALEKSSASKENEEVLKLVVKREESQEEVDLLRKIGQALAKIYTRIPAPVSFPKIFQVSGKVKSEITSMPAVKVSNFAEVVQYLKAVETRLGQMTTAISMIATQKPPTFPEIKVPAVDVTPIVDAINQIPGYEGGSNEDVITGLNRVYEAIATLANRPSMTTPPATHMSINSLNGTFHTTTLNIGTTATKIPPTSLANRRSLIVYNNSGSNTIYLGDVNVASAGTGQGLPIPPNSYSPAFDAGSNMSIYAIGTATTSITVLEISDEASGR